MPAKIRNAYGRGPALALTALLLIAAPATRAFAQGPPDRDYLVYVLSESSDKISVVRFGPGGGRVDKEFSTGAMPIDVDGPHGIVFSPDKQFYYVSLGHGRPFGAVWKYSSKDDRVVGRVTLGHFPATVDVTRDGQFLYVANFNLHGDMVPSSVSIVATDLMMEVARVKTCIMPHGSRINPQGSRHYSVCMMDDRLVEIDTSTFKVSRSFVLTRGREKGEGGPPPVNESQKHSAHDMSGHGEEPPKRNDPSCSPTWAQPSPDGNSIYVACNKSDEIVEIDAAWKVARRMPARGGVYNLAVTKDNRLVATNKRDQSISVFDLRSGRELARIPTRRRVLHGATVSSDDRYAFVSVEGVGSEPGTVEVVDLKSLKIVASIDVAPQAAGIEFFRTEPPLK
ncbi:MAG TPA: beta-propeller fold lactonase family protein [Blastocatellia bacterium]|nr:beta-propeller fold lactonase family protein [Blastocatellia bacterium]